MEFQDDDLVIFARQGAPSLPRPDREDHVARDGARLWFAVFGTGAPVILLHGGLGHAGNWGHQIPALRAAGFAVLVMDSRGHGRSTRDAQPLTYERMAADVRHVMDAVNWKKAALVGWSDGACTALVLARQHPERVSAVYFFACNMDPSGAKPFVATPVIDRCFQRHAADYAALSSTPDQFENFVEAVTQMMQTEPNYTARDLREVTVPVAVALGENDEFITAAHADYLAQTLPDAQRISLPSVSHFAPLQRPRIFNSSLLTCLRAWAKM